MEAIILAGGFGTRLKSLVADVPKPMAAVAGLPFLDHLLRHMAGQGIRHVVISVGYKAENLTEYFKSCFWGIDVSYSHENEPLGTGGAIRRAFGLIRESNCAVLNGDSFFDVSLSDLAAVHSRMKADATLSLKWVRDASRYGCVKCEEDRIIAFDEKRANTAPGFINGGVYFCERNLFESVDLPQRFSFEYDFLRRFCREKRICGFASDGFFIDIGVPEDYLRAQELPYFLNSAQIKP